jgi:protein SCO1
MSLRSTIAWMLAANVAAGCAPRPREYELRGVVVGIDTSRQEITIKHDDIPRFMPGMTMPFKVKEAALLEGRVPGDLVRATLVVEENGAHLRTLERTGSGVAPAAEPAPPRPLETGAEVPDASFVDQNGVSRRLSSWRGHAVAVTFIYTRCPIPNFCPLMDRHFAEAQRAVLADETLRARVRLLSVTIDPGHDRPGVLAAHARRVGADGSVWTWLTGEGGDIDAFASRFGVSVLREGASAGDLVHNLRTAVIDPGGSLAAILRGNEWTPDDLLAALRKTFERR